jgi:hypothetical protein
MWVLALLFLMIYMAAVLGRIFFGKSTELRATLLKKNIDISEYFGTIPDSMITLLGFSLHDNANRLQREIGAALPAAWIFFLVFFVLVSVGMMELMTSLFIDSLFMEKKKIAMDQKQAEMDKRQRVEDMLSGLFTVFDGAHLSPLRLSHS